MSVLNEPQLSELMSRAQNGDALAYQDLLSQLEKFLMSFLAKTVRQDEHRLDITQEVLMAVHKSRHTYVPDRPFTSWFFAIVHYKLSDHLRETYRDRKFEDLSETLESETANALDSMIAHARQQKLLSSIDSLDARSQAVVKGLKLDEKSVADLSAELHISPSNIKVIAHRAYETLRKKLENL